MSLVRNPGRVAGLWYLLLIIIGPLRLMYIPNKIFDYDNPAATVGNIAAHQLLFGLGIVADLLGALVLVFLTLAFYRLFVEVNRGLAVQVVIFGGIMPALLYFVGVACDLAALMVARGSASLSAFDPPQRHAIAVLFLRLRDQQNTAAMVLWGIWLIPLAILIYRSRFVPRFLGVWLILNGAAWISLSVTRVLWPLYGDRVYAISQPAILGEIAIMLWLLIRGANPQSVADATTA